MSSFSFITIELCHEAVQRRLDGCARPFLFLQTRKAKGKRLDPRFVSFHFDGMLSLEAPALGDGLLPKWVSFLCFLFPQGESIADQIAAPDA